MLKQTVKTIVSKLGFEIRRKRDSYSGGQFHPAYLAKLCRPRTVIDVGVGYGTHELYQAFPDAKFILVEPLREYEEAISALSRQYDCEVYYNAVSDAPSVQEFSIDVKNLQKSSFSKRTRLTETSGQLEKRLVDVTTLDAIAERSSSMQEPVVLKIDTEGHELKVLQGARGLLRRTEIVIAEVSVAGRFEVGYRFEDVIMFMNENDYYLFAILNVAHSKDELRPRFADIVFKKQP